MSSGTTAEPIQPDAPVTKTRMQNLQLVAIPGTGVPRTRVDVSYCHQLSTGCQPPSSTTIGAWARWEPDARGRLEEAALALYSERGFEQTTVAEIASGRDSPSGRSSATSPTSARSCSGAGAPPGAPGEDRGRARRTPRRRSTRSPRPWQPPATCSRSAANTPGQRQAVIAANAELQERELIKLAHLRRGARRRTAPARGRRAGREPGRRGGRSPSSEPRLHAGSARPTSGTCHC